MSEEKQSGDRLELPLLVRLPRGIPVDDFVHVVRAIDVALHSWTTLAGYDEDSVGVYLKTKPEEPPELLDMRYEAYGEALHRLRHVFGQLLDRHREVPHSARFLCSISIGGFCRTFDGPNALAVLQQAVAALDESEEGEEVLEE